MSNIEISQPTDLERGEVNETTLQLDLDTLTDEQLKSHALALRLEVSRKAKKLDEYQSSCDALSRTIAEQSETLQNRQTLVDELHVDCEQLAKTTESYRLQVDELEGVVKAARGNIEAKEAAMLTALNERPPQDTQELAMALEVYGLGIARASDTSHAPHVAVTMIQMGMHIRNMDWGSAMAWLRGEQLQITK